LREGFPPSLKDALQRFDGIIDKLLDGRALFARQIENGDNTITDNKLPAAAWASLPQAAQFVQFSR